MTSVRVQPVTKEVKRVAVLARAKPFEPLWRFRERVKKSAEGSGINGKPLQLSGEYVKKRVPAIRVFGKWFNFKVWTTKLIEEHYG